MPIQASALAQNGYIVTAMGGDTSDGYILVGTRVQGDIMPRPFAVVNSSSASPNDQIYGKGFSLIGAIDNADGTITFLGEK